MDKLKVGDKVVKISRSRWGNNTNYTFATVTRITKTQAILSNDVKLINEPTKRPIGKEIGFPIYGNKWTFYINVTDEIIEEANQEKKRQTICNWFSEKEFTEDDKKIIYETFEKLNKL